MQFHEYVNYRNRIAKLGDRDDPRVSAFKRMTAAEARLTILEGCDVKQRDDFERAIEVMAEHWWVERDRPFYNVWPIAEQLAREVKLDVRFSAVKIPFEALLLRFARGHEPHGLAAAMLFWEPTQPIVGFVGFVLGRSDWFVGTYHYDSNECVETWLRDIESVWVASDWRSKAEAGESAHLHLISLMVRLVVFIGLTANDHDFITPVILSKDQAKYDSTDDVEVKKWLEDRAARRAGRGFDVGKQLQAEREASPHWRNPHLCLFWTGEGRTKPIIQMRRGAIVQRVSMADVPTGYLGPETDEESVYSEATPRESISKARRFAIFQRDGYRCRLCGRSAEDGATLHVDHRVPLAKGGSNEDDNLWTACDDCNLGKSDTVL